MIPADGHVEKNPFIEIHLETSTRKLSSSNLSRVDRNLNNGGKLGIGSEIVVASQIIYHDDRYPYPMLLTGPQTLEPARLLRVTRIQLALGPENRTLEWKSPKGVLRVACCEGNDHYRPSVREVIVLYEKLDHGAFELFDLHALEYLHPEDLIRSSRPRDKITP